MRGLILYFIIKKIPELVQGLLSGQPSLAGGGLVATAKNVSNSAAKAGAVVATGGASMAKAAATGALQGGAVGAGKFKAAGGGRAGAVMGAIGGGMLGAANNVAGSMAKGAAGMMKNSILGSNNNNTGSGGVGARWSQWWPRHRQRHASEQSPRQELRCRKEGTVQQASRQKCRWDNKERRRCL